MAAFDKDVLPLGPAFTDALTYASHLHAAHTRKGGQIPYIGHLLSVTSLVIEAGGTETQVIAALLHDAAEDQGGQPRIEEIERKFGPAVARIVAACSDTFAVPKPQWCERKKRYLAHLEEADPEVLLVSLADKVDNARAILRDFRTHGDSIWVRFNNTNPDDQIWYYRSLADVFQRRCPGALAAEFGRVLDELTSLMEPPALSTSGG